MKYLVVLYDGMADYSVEELGNKTPLEAADCPNMDRLAKEAEVGTIKTVADGLKPGSDVANLSVLGYDPADCYTGRSPLEAGSIGIDMKDTDVSLRCNLVTLSDEAEYSDKTILDYCADDISTEEAEKLVEYLAEKLNNDEFKFYSGVSYRHCLIWDKGTLDIGTLTPPHDITGKPIKEYIPSHPNAAKLYELMKKSYDLLKNHPVNIARIERGLRPANSIWLWGEGVKANLEDFKNKFGLKASMISAVDLLKGIGKFAGMNVVNVEGATGYIDTNFDGKAQAAIDEFKNGQDFVYIHVEAPDECGHRHEIENKVKAIELIDGHILGPVSEYLSSTGEDFKILITPDHATPLSLKTHTNDPVPFMIYSSKEKRSGVDTFNEKTAEKTGLFIDKGHTIMNRFING
ncbi:MAG: cofactor-independent phosphoglycerate mutase [Clostridium sp.]|nr:cofactor-independent phosphoglycerate mutase [Clostridium sp.]MCM1547074.1 cofactor-independent phosphoglycerate mutase [Ruminococcus sp.]